MRPTGPLKVIYALATFSAVFVFTGCGSDSSGGNVAATGETGYVQGAEITDAQAWRDELLAIAATSYDKENKKSRSRGIVEGWQAAFPSVLTQDQIVGFAVDPPANGISGFALVLDKANDGEMLPFRVADTNGVCAAGVVRVTYDDVVSIEALSNCSEVDKL